MLLESSFCVISCKFSMYAKLTLSKTFTELGAAFSTVFKRAAFYLTSFIFMIFLAFISKLAVASLVVFAHLYFNIETYFFWNKVTISDLNICWPAVLHLLQMCVSKILHINCHHSCKLQCEQVTAAWGYLDKILQG